MKLKERIVILGAGESGTGAALLAHAQGYEVFVSDGGLIRDIYKEELRVAGIGFEESGHSLDQILNAQLVIKSPGIPESATIVEKLRLEQIRIIAEIEFAHKFTEASFVAITGTNGKTTTTLLTHHILKHCGFNVGLAGNIGQSLARQVLNDGERAKNFYVVELSSFQLDDMYEFKAHVAILLNITPDHLDRYQNDFSEYTASKFRILQNMEAEDAFIYWAEDDVINHRVGDGSIKPRSFPISLKDQSEARLRIGDDIYPKDNIPLKGKHNDINVMSAISAATFLGADQEQILNALSSFNNAPHRMEFAGQIEGITFINDSKATNVDSVYYALDAFETGITWIAGGRDKGNDYSRISSLVRKKVGALICLGADNTKLKTTFGNILL